LFISSKGVTHLRRFSGVTQPSGALLHFLRSGLGTPLIQNNNVFRWGHMITVFHQLIDNAVKPGSFQIST